MYKTSSIVYIFLAAFAATAEEAPSPDGTTVSGLSYKTVSAREFQVTPDTGEDMGAPLSALIHQIIKEQTPAIIQLEKGTYYLDGNGCDHSVFMVDHARNLIIRGEGPETRLIVGRPSIGTFFFSSGEDLWVEDLSIDYDPLPYTQGRVLVVNAKGGWFDLAIDPGYALLSEPWFANAPDPDGKWGMIFSPKEPALKPGAADFVYIEKWEQLGKRAWRLFPPAEHTQRLADLRMGDRFVQLARHGKGGAVFFWRCVESGVRNVHIYASQSVAVGAVSTDRITVSRLFVGRKPDTDRLVSTDADAVHIQQNLRGPVIEECLFESMADDGINIYYPSNIVTSIVSETAVRTDRSGIIEPGDRLQLFDAMEGRILLETKAESVVPGPDNEYRVTLDKALPELEVGAVHGLSLHNVSRCGADFIIRRNTFRNHRRHGMVIKAPQGVIEDNVMESLGGYGIVVGNDAETPEGIVPYDLSISGNHIREVGRSRWYGVDNMAAALQITTHAERGRLAKERAIHGITLRNNRFENPPGPALYIGAARNIHIDTLQISYSENSVVPKKTAAIVIENADTIGMKRIQVESQQKEVHAGVLICDSVDEGLEGADIEEIQITGPITMETVRDERQ